MSMIHLSIKKGKKGKIVKKGTINKIRSIRDLEVVGKWGKKCGVLKVFSSLK